ncbi:MAG TPA: imidazole glycerol phosphate synthase subunit HisH [Limnochordia bacterium]|nr:imidazole glycerol phosphate synthase subunit HisH [Limnochordia bacterium]
MKIAILDYGAGNLRSVHKAFTHVGLDAEITSEPARARSAGGLVLPGVGAFGKSMENLHRFGLSDVVYEHVAAGRPFAGICVGLQLLFERSAERFDAAAGGDAGDPVGLGLLAGQVLRFPESVRIPQIGWNQLRIRKPEPLFRGVAEGAHVYFLHSYYAKPQDPRVIAAGCDYGVEYCAALAHENLVALQFHPEKSGRVGLAILANLGAWMHSRV